DTPRCGRGAPCLAGLRTCREERRTPHAASPPSDLHRWSVDRLSAVSLRATGARVEVDLAGNEHKPHTRPAAGNARDDHPAVGPARPTPIPRTASLPRGDWCD